MTDYRELLIGCGNSRTKRIKHGNVPAEWQDLTTLDIDPACNPHIVHDLERLPLPLESNWYDELHAYEVLEHTGRQGDFRFFFAQFYEFWRVLKPGGLMCITVPLVTSPWAWGDPGHTRVLPLECFYFLSQKLYENEVGKTATTDYRGVWKGDFELRAYNEFSDSLGVILKAIKD